MRIHESTHAGLRCRTLGDDDKDVALVVVLCHGYGAPGHDLVGLGPELLEGASELAGRVRFVFPEAPRELPFGADARAWWHFDINRYQRAMQSGDMSPVVDEVPAGATEARRMIIALTDELAQRAKLPRSRIVLGGFSQGAMLTADVALRLEEAPAGVVLFSGAPIGRGEWRARGLRRTGMPVVQAHGVDDPVVPFAAGAALHDALQDAGCVVDFSSFRGGHTIGAGGLDAARALLVRALARIDAAA